jgi:hypothetical protein
MKLCYRVQILWPLLFLLGGCNGNRDLKVFPSPPLAKSEAVHGETEGCKGDLFVLLPDPNGKIGSIRVENAGGSQILDKAGDMTRAKDFNRPPFAPRPLDEKKIASMFGDALSAQPDLRLRFIPITLWFKSDTTKLVDESKKTLPKILRELVWRNWTVA